jgi:addiction module HigA family antidote
MKQEIHLPHVHPGQVLKDELDELGISQSALAGHIGVLPKTINEICRGKRGISAEMAWKLSRSLGASPNFWMNLQDNWELAEVSQERFIKLSKIAA